MDCGGGIKLKKMEQAHGCLSPKRYTGRGTQFSLCGNITPVAVQVMCKVFGLEFRGRCCISFPRVFAEISTVVLLSKGHSGASLDYAVPSAPVRIKEVIGKRIYILV